MQANKYSCSSKHFIYKLPGVDLIWPVGHRLATAPLLDCWSILMAVTILISNTGMPSILLVFSYLHFPVMHSN